MANLSATEIEAALKDLPGWRLEADKLVRDFLFADFTAAMLFVNRTAGIAEAIDHHPDIDVRFNKVRLALISHDVGGLTKRDLRLAARINEAEGLA